MKKSKILVPAVALLALSMGAAATGTVAWFSVETANKSVVADAGNAITAVSGVTKSDAFTITAVTSSNSYGNVILTNDAGQTYMTYNSGSAGSREDVLVSATGNAGVAVTVTLSISYTGSATTAAEVESAWDAAVSSVLLTWVDTSDNTGVATDPAADNTNYLKEVEGVNDGSKVADFDRANSALDTAIPATVGFSTPSGSGSEKTSTATNLGSTTIIVGINGIDGRIQDSWTYSFSVTPVVA